MSNLVSSAAYDAAQIANSQTLAVKRSYLSEILAALLGYRTLAALKVEDADPTLPYHLADAEMLVVNIPMGLERVKTFNLPDIIVETCVTALKSSTSIPVFQGVDDFYDSYAREAIEETIYNGESVASVMADSNANYPDNPDLEGYEETAGNLWAAKSEWTIEASGTLSGEYDLDGDRMFNGDTLDVWAKLIFAKAGRAGLVYVESEEGASADDDWRDIHAA